MAFSPSRITRLAGLWLLCCCLLVGRLTYLQIIEGSRLAAMGIDGRVQEVPVEVARGEILDRNGVPLTNTAQHFSVIIFPGQIDDFQTTVNELAALTGAEASKLADRLREDTRPFKLRTDIDAVTAQRINHRGLPGVIAVAERIRYGSSPLGAHVVGYINASDNKGMSGVERLYDEILRGNQAIYLAAMVDAGQKIIPGLGYKRIRPLDGTGPCNVVLTIDSRVQKIVENVLDQRVPKGAVVVLRPSTGEVLAMASRPNFDGNNLGDYLNRNSAPLLNRAVAAFQPGSVFKLAVAAAALETGIVRPEDVFFDSGYIDVNGLRFKGWDYELGMRGRLTFSDAMVYSSNPVFIQIGLKLGAERLVGYARKLGFGQKTGHDFDGEADGNLPLPEVLFPGDLANLSIGQGTLEATPLQIAGLVATIVNDGVRIDPYLVSRLTTQEGVVVKNFCVSRGNRVLSKETASVLREMMKGVTSRGTGQAAYVEGFGSAGKTGTAETGRHGENGKGINHAWFAGYAPLDNSQYVVVVFVEDGMSGGDIAAPVFHDIVARILSSG